MLRRWLSNGHRRLPSRARLNVEPLEGREVPATMVNASTLTYRDIDGDDVTVKFSKNILTAANVNSIFTFSSGAMAVNGDNNTKEALWSIDLTGVAGAAGTNVTVTAVKGKAGGDGFANLGELLASNLDLGLVAIDGDLGRVVAGDTNAATIGMKGLTAQSLGRFGVSTGAANLFSTIHGKLGALTVKSDVKDVRVTVTGGADGDIGPVSISGALLGLGFLNTGVISAEGDIASVVIQGDVVGNLLGCGQITAGGNMGAVTINGSLKGLSLTSGQIIAGGTLGAVKIQGDVVGSSHSSGVIQSGGKLASVTIGGSLLGGSGEESGQIVGNGIGPVKITGSIKGGMGDSSGSIRSQGDLGAVMVGGDVIGLASRSGAIVGMGKVASVTIGGSLVGGALDNNESYSSGQIYGDELGAVKIGVNLVGGGESQGAGLIHATKNFASVTIGGSILGGDYQNTGTISCLGNIGPVTVKGSIVGQGWDSARIFANKIASVTVNGSLIGNEGGTASIQTSGDLGPVTILGDVIGGEFQSGRIRSAGNAASITIGGSLRGGSEAMAGVIDVSGTITKLSLTGDLIGGSASGNDMLIESGYIHAKRIATLTIGGSVIAGVDNTSNTFRNNGAIRVDDDLGMVSIKGSLIGNATNPVIISARGQATPVAKTDMAINSLNVGGRAEFAQILAGVTPMGTAKNADAQIGTVTIGGDWIASTLAAGADPGADMKYGTADDGKLMGADVKDSATVVSSIKSVTIAGQALGTVGGTDHYGIVAELVSAVKIGGTALNLSTGIDLIPLGITGDLFVREL